MRCYKVVANASSGNHVPFVVITRCSWLGLCCWMLLWNGKPALRESESVVFHACVCCFHLYSAFAESSCCLYDIPLKKFKEMKRKMICSYFIWCFLSQAGHPSVHKLVHVFPRIHAQLSNAVCLTVNSGHWSLDPRHQGLCDEGFSAKSCFIEVNWGCEGFKVYSGASEAWPYWLPVTKAVRKASGTNSAANDATLCLLGLGMKVRLLIHKVLLSSLAI